jgi:hypothetical protein
VATVTPTLKFAVTVVGALMVTVVDALVGEATAPPVEPQPTKA